MMTTEDIGKMLDLLESNYGAKFFDGVDRKNVISLWSTIFKDDDPSLVLQGVLACINTSPYKPAIADIRIWMAKSQMGGQMTSIEAFNEISKAVDKAYDRESATKLYNGMSPILQTVVGSPSRLISWHNVSDESFQTVIMSAIRESYRELSKREADYYALPKQLQKSEEYLIKEPNPAALPEAEIEKSVDEIIAESNQKAAEYGMQMTPELAQKHADGVAAFLKPMTDDEIKMVEAREEAKSMRFMKC